MYDIICFNLRVLQIELEERYNCMNVELSMKRNGTIYLYSVTVLNIKVIYGMLPVFQSEMSHS
jgi:hypothetical protein